MYGGPKTIRLLQNVGAPSLSTVERHRRALMEGLHMKDGIDPKNFWRLVDMYRWTVRS
jgi:hypothetical protein